MFPAGLSPPPSSLPGTPVEVVLPAGTNLWRVHSADYTSIQFNPNAPKSPYAGGRFDSKNDNDPYLYAGDSAECAIGEVWDRDLGSTPNARLVPKATLNRRMLSQIRTKIDLTLIDVGTPAASQFGQSSWFTQCEPHEYVFTREWAHWLRRAVPTASGFSWRSKRNANRFSYVFFELRITSATAPFEQVRSLSVERGKTKKLVVHVLAQHNAAFGR